MARKATVIPVKILNQAGWGWSSVIAEGILYIANLKAGVLRNSPVVINMSLGGPVLDALEKAAVDYAISQGVILVVCAGNSGPGGMWYPGGYAPVISVAAAGWDQEFSAPNWAFGMDVPDPTNTTGFYIAAWSSRQLAGQDLDVAAPGVNVVGPYQVNSGHTTYFFLSGTSMACPHVAGIVALMAQKKSTLTAAEAETILQATAIPMSEGQAAAGSGFATANAALAALP
jgi:subtilisin family serine protease